jgi:hypothetical protein
VTTQEPTHVISCCNLLTPVHQLPSNSWSARMSFSQVQWVFTVKHYLASCSYLTCKNEFRDTFPDSHVPNKSTISRLVNCFHDTGSVQGRNRYSRPLVLSGSNLDDIRQTLLCSPQRSLRKLSLQSGLSYGSVHKATKIWNFIHTVHMPCTNSRNLMRRLQYYRWFTHFIQGGTDILDKVFYSDETWFHQNGYINSQNSRIQSA